MIDSRADIHPTARIAADVSIGPWTHIGPEVEIGSGTWIGPHVVIKGPTIIGKANKIYQFSSIGEDPQDKKYQGEPTLLTIGDRNQFREFTTINRGTVQGGNLTAIGNDNLLMAYVHIAHDCIVANHTIFANYAALAGHVKVEDYVILGGYAGVHQFCTLGAHSFVAKASIVGKDVLPYTLVAGHSAAPAGLNSEGLKRRGFSPESIQAIKKAYKIIYRQDLTVADALPLLTELAQIYPEIQLMITALQQSQRGIVR